MKIDFTLEQLKSYLLGNIQNDLAEKIDVEVISNKKFEETLIIAEENLIEEYVEGELNSEEETLFHKNFLTNEERKSQLLIISQLKQYSKIDNKEESDGSSIEESEPNFFQRLRFVSAKPAFTVIWVFALLGVISGVVWISYSSNSNGLSALETEFAELNKSDFKSESDSKDYSKLVLINGKTRSLGKSNELRRSTLKEKVFFNLAIQSDLEGIETFGVELSKDGKVVFTQPEISILKNDFGAELKFLIPSKVLELGQYQIKVKSNRNIDNKVTYSFVIR